MSEAQSSHPYHRAVQIPELCLLPASRLFYLAYSYTLKMEATCSSETSVNFGRTTLHYMPEDTAVRTSNPACYRSQSG
jgi:hypothetical protein